jgi:hypothetical protein
MKTMSEITRRQADATGDRAFNGRPGGEPRWNHQDRNARPVRCNGWLSRNGRHHARRVDPHALGRVQSVRTIQYGESASNGASLWDKLYSVFAHTSQKDIVLQAVRLSFRQLSWSSIIASKASSV